jgi:hypothetical protein
VRTWLVDLSGRHRQQFARHRDIRIRRNDVDVVRLHARAVDGLADHHRRGLGQRFAQETGVRGIEVLDEDERHAAISRKLLEQLRERLEPSRRGAHPDNRKFVRKGVRNLAQSFAAAGCGASPSRFAIAR